MKNFLTLEQIQAKCAELNEVYQIDEEKFYGVVDKWVESEASPENKLLASYQELLQVVNEEMEGMQKAVDLTPSCQIGCAYCCYFPIIINEMEAKLMKKAIAAFPKERREELEVHFHHYYEKYDAQLKELTALDFEEDKDFKRTYRKSGVPCVMLDTKTNQCMAYEIRPIPCRTYVNYATPDVCKDNLMPKETVSFEFLYAEYMGALNEFIQFLYENEHTAFIDYPNDVYAHDYIANWFKQTKENSV